MTLAPEAVATIARKVATARKEKKSFAVLTLGLFVLLLAMATAALFVYYGREVKSLKRKTRAIEKVFPFFQEDNSHFSPLLGNISIPQTLQTTPLA